MPLTTASLCFSVQTLPWIKHCESPFYIFFLSFSRGPQVLVCVCARAQEKEEDFIYFLMEIFVSPYFIFNCLFELSPELKLFERISLFCVLHLGPNHSYFNCWTSNVTLLCPECLVMCTYWYFQYYTCNTSKIWSFERKYSFYTTCSLLYISTLKKHLPVIHFCIEDVNNHLYLLSCTFLFKQSTYHITISRIGPNWLIFIFLKNSWGKRRQCVI